MNARLALALRHGAPLRALLLAAVASALLGGALQHALSARNGGAVASAPASTSDDFAGLSPAAQASISATLGADDPAYHFKALAGGFQAANAEQQFVVSANHEGVSIRKGSLSLSMRLQAIGYGGSLQAVNRLAPAGSSNRVGYAHGGVEESYTNGPLGLDQSFTITRAPHGGSPGVLTLAIALSGNAPASLAPGGQSVLFTTAGDSSLRYSGLNVTDARGHSLHGSLALQSGTLLLRVDARGAKLPLRVDPLVTEAPEVPYRKLTPAAGVKQHAGMSVALSADGSTAVIGGPRLALDGPKGNEGGAVWVFTRGPGSEYTQVQELTAPSTEGSSTTCAEHRGGEPATGCSFGSALAVSSDGNTLLVGDPHAAEAGTGSRASESLEHAGAAYVYTKSVTESGIAWVETAKLKSLDPRTAGLFGRSVALTANGETALVGAPGEGDGGLAWVFSASGAAWTPNGEPLKGSLEEPEARFGKSVALSSDGEVAVVGAPNEEGHRGSAWVFEASAPGALLKGRTKLVGGEQQEGAQLGYSVAVSGEGATVLAGAPGFEAGGAPESTGAVWAFERSGSGWSEPGAKLTGPGERMESFGYSVALSANGQTAVVGAPRALEGSGEAWLYEHSLAGWGSATKGLVARPAEGGSEQGRGLFANSIASSASGEILLIGAPSNSGREGAAWIDARGPAVIRVTPSSGSPRGGTMVTIVGQHFAGATEVAFGEGHKSENVKVESESEIIAQAPEGVGKVPVTVTTPLGTSEPVSEDEFTYEPPMITSVAPISGPPTGGTVVTIRGEYFYHVTAVDFGPNAATSWEVESENVIKAVSPEGSVGTVEVTVKALSGDSTPTKADRFTYVPTSTIGGKHHEEEPETGTASNALNPTPISSGSSGGSAPAGGVLAAGPVVVNSCHATLLSAKILVQHSKLALFKLVGKGVGSCHGKLRLRVRIKLRGKRSVLKTIGTAVFSIAAGKRIAVKVALTHAGRTLLAADHGHLSANLLIARSSPLPVLAQTATVHLTPQPAKHKTKT